MHRIVRTLALAMLGAACGDGGFEPSQTITNGSPAGSTTIAGTVNANVSGEQSLGAVPLPFIVMTPFARVSRARSSGPGL